MKMIVLALVLAAAGCSKKGNDCEAALSKAIDTAAEAAKTRTTNPQILERITSLATLRKTTFVKRCVEDKWPADVVTCFAKAAAPKDAQECENKLSEENKNKIRNDMRAAMQADRGAMPNIPGHPQMLSGSGGSAQAPGTAPPAGAPGAPPAGAPPAGEPPAPPVPAAGSEPPSAAGTPPPAGSGK